jgi:hypothetical protein
MLRLRKALASLSYIFTLSIPLSVNVFVLDIVAEITPRIFKVGVDRDFIECLCMGRRLLPLPAVE